jgi:hypothetical protein
MAATYWAQVKEKYASLNPNDDVHTRWGELALFGENGFEELVQKSPNLPVTIEYLVQRFGEDGPEADLCWYLSLENYAAPKYGAVKTVQPNTERNTLLRRASFLMAESQCLSFVRNRALLLRYQHVLSWRRRWLDGGTKGANQFIVRIGDAQKMLSAEGDDYWWHLRHFLVLAATTGRMDLVPSKESGLKGQGEAMKLWLEWYEENGPYFRAHPIKPTWTVDFELKRSGYGYVRFINQGTLPPLIYDAKAPFADWPEESLPRDVAWQ